MISLIRMKQGKSFSKYSKTPRRSNMTPTSMLPAMVSKTPLWRMKRWVALHDCLPHLETRIPSKTIGKITSWTPSMTPTWMMTTAIIGMSLISTLTQWLRSHRYVSNFNSNTVADLQQLLVALGSLSSSVEQYIPHSANVRKIRDKIS